MGRSQVATQVHGKRKTPVAFGAGNLSHAPGAGRAASSGPRRPSIGLAEIEHAPDRLRSLFGDALPGDARPALLLTLLPGEFRREFHTRVFSPTATRAC